MAPRTPPAGADVSLNLRPLGEVEVAPNAGKKYDHRLTTADTALTWLG